jgi:hypothetical protein
MCASLINFEHAAIGCGSDETGSSSSAIHLGPLAT